MIDWERVTELRTEVGPENFDEVVDLFLFEVEDELTRLREFSNPEGMAARLHFLKGSALNLGFAAFSELCAVGEAAAGAEANLVNVDDVLACYSLSKQEFTRGLHRFAAA